jgi:hypothetical protein
MKKLLLILLLLSCRALAYDMPIGVPDAWIDPAVAAPARPSPWTTEQAGYYYVDWNTGTDSGRTYGTPSAPRKTIPNPVPAGARVELAAGAYGGGTLAAGEYSGAAELDLTAAGTSAAWAAGSAGPAWIIGANSLASIMTCPWIMHGSYCYIDGIKWPRIRYYRLQIGSGGADYPSDHFLIRNCEMDGAGGVGAYGMIIAGKLGFINQHTIIYNNIIHGYGNMATTIDEDNNALATGDYCFDLWVVNNTMHTCTAGIRAGSAGGAAGPETCQRLYIGGNHVYNILQSGIWVKYSQNVVFSSNYVHDIVDTPWSPSKCIGAQYAPKGLWMIYNRLEAGRYGVLISSTEGSLTETWPVYIIGNVITGARQPSGTYTSLGGYGNGAIAVWGSNERYIVGNTVFDNCSGILWPGNPAGITEVHNNVISGITELGTGADAGKHIVVGSEATNANTNIDNNLYYQSGGTAQIRWNSNLYTLSGFVAGTNEGDHDLEADPLFTNTAIGDFTLATGSPAIDTGSATVIDTLEALYLSTFGVTLAIDYAGNARPANAIYDMGAYEFGSTFADTTNPTLISATITAAGDSIVLALNESVQFGAGGNAGLSLTLSSGSVTATYTSGAGTSSLTYTLSGTLTNDITGTVTYTQPSNGIEDDAGNDLATLSGWAITNNSTQSNPAIPRLRDKPAMKRSILLGR